nr:secretin N-terminal domain-containing protein [Burkholderiaceae bacterium]
MSSDLRSPLSRPGAAPLAGHALRLGAVALALAHLVAQGQTPFNPFMQAPAGAAAPAPVNPFSQAPAAAPSPATAPSVPAAAQLPVRTLPAPLTPAPAPAASAPPPVPVPVPPVSPNPAPVSGQMPAPAAPAAPAGMAPLPPAGAVSAPPPSARSASQPAGSGRGTYAPALPTTPSGGVTLRFDNAEIYDVIQVILGDILRVDYVIDPSVQGRITIKSTEAVSPADIFNVLESALAMSNISIVRQGKTYRVTRDANAVRDVITGDPAGPGSPLLQVIPVRFVQASQLVNTLRNFIGPQAAITNDPTNKYLIVADRAANVAKIIDMVKVLDVDYLDKVRVRLVQAERADAADLAKEAEALFRTSGLFNIAGTDNTKVYFLPVVRMNAVLVAAANDPLANAAEQWIRMLDVEPKNSVGSMVHVYAVANTNVAHLAGVLRQLFGGGAGAAQPTTTSTTPALGQQGIGSGASAFGQSATGATGLAGAATGAATSTANTANRTITSGNAAGYAIRIDVETTFQVQNYGTIDDSIYGKSIPEEHM